MKIKVYEVGARDGLQNESTPVTPEQRIELIERLVDAGITFIEAGSFVSPKWIPQMAGTETVYNNLNRKPGVRYAALVPNMKGMEAAIASDVNEVAVFAAASEAFSQKNINCSIEESIARFQPVMQQAKAHNIPVRGYVSCVLGCPYEGDVDPSQVVPVVNALFEMGCYEVSLGDTIGVGTPASMKRLLEALLPDQPHHLAVHCHDTYGQALSNIYAAIQLGLGIVDSSVAGLGGCPYAKGASGNVATEDLLYMLHGMGIETGIDLNKVVAAGQTISDLLGRQNMSKASAALQAKATQ